MPSHEPNAARSTSSRRITVRTIIRTPHLPRTITKE